MRNIYLTASPTFPWQRALHKLGSVAVVWSKSFEILRWILRYNANCVHYHTPEFIDSRFSKSPCHTYMSFKYRYVTNIRSASWCCDDDVIKWKHFPRYWPFVRGIDRSPVDSPHKGQWRAALALSMICTWKNGWVNNRDYGDLRSHHTHYDVTVIIPRYQCRHPFAFRFLLKKMTQLTYYLQLGSISITKLWNAFIWVHLLSISRNNIGYEVLQ